MAAVSPTGDAIANVGCSVAGTAGCDSWIEPLGADLSPQGEARRLTEVHGAITGLSWMPDGRSLVATVLDQPASVRVSLAGPSLRRRADATGLGGLAGLQANHIDDGTPARGGKLWSEVKARQAATRRITSNGDPSRFNRARRPRFLFSGLTKCGECGGGDVIYWHDRLACFAARARGTCTNRHTISRQEVEERVLSALRDKLMRRELFEEFCRENAGVEPVANGTSRERLEREDTARRCRTRDSQADSSNQGRRPSSIHQGRVAIPRTSEGPVAIAARGPGDAGAAAPANGRRRSRDGRSLCLALRTRRAARTLWKRFAP